MTNRKKATTGWVLVYHRSWYVQKPQARSSGWLGYQFPLHGLPGILHYKLSTLSETITKFTSMRGILDALLGISAEVAAEWSLRDFMDSRGDVSLSCRKRIKQPVKLCFSSQLPTQRYQLRHTPCTPCVPSLRRHHQGPDMIFLFALL
jgi:hypothetical protein